MNLVKEFVRKKYFAVALGVPWLIFIFIGFAFLLTYANRAGEVGKVVADWPANSALARDSTRPTLVLFAHPKCPCTRATASELERLIAQIKGYPLSIYILMYSPSDVNESWTKTSLRQTFESIPGAVVKLDRDGVDAARFGATTSGQAILYDKDGKLIFRGGITAARGHEGDNQGRDDIVSFVTKGVAAGNKTSVFGCSIRKPASIGWKQF